MDNAQKIVLIEDDDAMALQIQTALGGFALERARSYREAMRLVDNLKLRCLWIVDGNFPLFSGEPGSIGTHGPDIVRAVRYDRSDEIVIAYTSDVSIFEQMETENRPDFIFDKDTGFMGAEDIIRRHMG